MGTAGTKAGPATDGLVDLQVKAAGVDAAVAPSSPAGDAPSSAGDATGDIVTARQGEALPEGRTKSALLANIEAKQELVCLNAHLCVLVALALLLPFLFPPQRPAPSLKPCPQSYYFAHKPRETGEPRAPPPVHKPLEGLEPGAGVPQHYETIRSYLFSDEVRQ